MPRRVVPALSVTLLTSVWPPWESYLIGAMAEVASWQVSMHAAPVDQSGHLFGTGDCEFFLLVCTHLRVCTVGKSPQRDIFIQIIHFPSNAVNLPGVVGTH